jgi:hypothetical protein
VIQFHRVHSRLPADNPRSDEIFERTQAERTIRARKGLAQISNGDFTLRRYGRARDEAVIADADGDASVRR